MNRKEYIESLKKENDGWDFIIIGGGATGLGIAVDAASRGFKTVLLEQGDFALGTSSRSTKLVHGGVRYLRQGNFSLVLEALRERGLLRNNAPHLVQNLAFIVPIYDWWEGPFYGMGLKIYDLLAGDLGLGPSKNISREETIKALPTVEPEGLRGGVIYYDAQFDDSRLAIALAKTACQNNALAVNYCRVEKLVKKKKHVHGVIVKDLINNQEMEITGKVVINATGVFCDSIRRMDDPQSRDIISPSQGVHIILDRSFLPGDSAIIIPHTDDDRVLFAVPWHDKVIVGTTDTPVSTISIEPLPLQEEIDFLLSHAARYLTKDPTKEDVLSVFAGIRPLVNSSDVNSSATLSREHSLLISKSGLITITGGKWTTYRKMAEQTVNQAINYAGLDQKSCVTESLKLAGWTEKKIKNAYMQVYGSEYDQIKKLMHEKKDWKDTIHPELPYLKAEIIWAIRNEMAYTLCDFLCRRTRSIILNARASIECATEVATIMAQELGKDNTWIKTQVHEYNETARLYIIQ